jgi:hypothetical protein
MAHYTLNQPHNIGAPCSCSGLYGGHGRHAVYGASIHKATLAQDVRGALRASTEELRATLAIFRRWQEEHQIGHDGKERVAWPSHQARGAQRAPPATRSAHVIDLTPLEYAYRAIRLALAHSPHSGGPRRLWWQLLCEPLTIDFFALGRQADDLLADVGVFAQ